MTQPAQHAVPTRTNGRLSWHNITGLTREQRLLGAKAWPNLNLAVVIMTDTSVDGVVIPDIKHGVVYRGYRLHLGPSQDDPTVEL